MPISSLSLQMRWLDLPELVPELVVPSVSQEGVRGALSEATGGLGSSCGSQSTARDGALSLSSGPEDKHLINWCSPPQQVTWLESVVECGVMITLLLRCKR